MPAKNGRDIFPVKTANRHHISEIQRNADENDEDKIGEPDDARNHDRRICPLYFLVGDRKGCRRQPAAPFDRWAIRRRGRGGRSRGI
jgi:hypothetical protein